MIYEVELEAPAIYELVMVDAANEEQAVEDALYSAVQRMLKDGSATATVVPITPVTPVT